MGVTSYIFDSKLTRARDVVIGLHRNAQQPLAIAAGINRDRGNC